MRKFKLFFGVVALAIIFGFVFLASSMFEQVEADEIVVIRDPIDGDLHYYFSPELVWQNFGTATTYKKESQYWFSSDTDQGDRADQSIRIRFNDGGHARISGSVRWKMPMNTKAMEKIHTLYGSQEAIEQQLVRTVIEKSVYMTGPLMSSKESYAERRNDLISFIEDQATGGVYRTKTMEYKDKDPLSGVEKTFTKVIIIESTPGTRSRQETSPLAQHSISIYNLSLNKIAYNKTVEGQIKTQQQAIMDVQTAIAQAMKAEQDAIKAEKQGQASAAKAKWDQEIIKATKVTEAEQKRDIAKLDMDAAKYYKQQQILKGQGEAERKRLVMQADGALKQKLDALITINKNYAEAIYKYKGNWVPGIVMGGSSKGTGTSGGNGANMLIDLLTVKTAKDLGVDTKIPMKR